MNVEVEKEIDSLTCSGWESSMLAQKSGRIWGWSERIESTASQTSMLALQRRSKETCHGTVTMADCWGQSFAVSLDWMAISTVWNRISFAHGEQRRDWKETQGKQHSLLKWYVKVLKRINSYKNSSFPSLFTSSFNQLSLYKDHTPRHARKLGHTHWYLYRINPHPKEGREIWGKSL